MKKRRNRSVAVGLIALFVSVAMFAVTILARYAFQNTEQYSVGWIKYFTYFPNSLVALIPIGLLVIAFFVMLYEASCTISYLRADPSHKSVQEMLEIIDYDFKQKRAFLYGAIVIAALYAVMQVITFIWGPGFRVSISPEESEGQKTVSYDQRRFCVMDAMEAAAAALSENLPAEERERKSTIAFPSAKQKQRRKGNLGSLQALPSGWAE